ncbi:MAG: DUF1330 domain-containing protein [Candidatus Desulfofervidaceae bacterium]|nr:DUF1330 domain-containing protein [Candidatus Desulfofervidaceae bacterium]
MRKKVPEIISKYGGRYLTRGGKITPLSGNWNPERIIRKRAYFDSPRK